jgi:IS5 family transposase
LSFFVHVEYSVAHKWRAERAALEQSDRGVGVLEQPGATRHECRDELDRHYQPALSGVDSPVRLDREWREGVPRLRAVRTRMKVIIGASSNAKTNPNSAGLVQ